MCARMHAHECSHLHMQSCMLHGAPVEVRGQISGVSLSTVAVPGSERKTSGFIASSLTQSVIWSPQVTQNVSFFFIFCSITEDWSCGCEHVREMFFYGLTALAHNFFCILRQNLWKLPSLGLFSYADFALWLRNYWEETKSVEGHLEDSRLSLQEMGKSSSLQRLKSICFTHAISQAGFLSGPGTNTAL